MAFININANFSIFLSLIERGIRALERMAGPELEVIPDNKKRGPKSITVYGDQEREWAKEHFRETIHKQGFDPTREESLMTVAMKRYDYTQRNQNPNDAELED